MKRLFFLLFWLMTDEFAMTQTANDTVYIPEIEVIARKKLEETGLKITRPDSMAMWNGITSTLSELLTQHTPVFIRSYGRGSQATANFRGSAASHTQLLWNGIGINSPSRGYADLSLLPALFVDDVSLLHGGSSLSESTGALGGSIQLRNNPDWGTKSRILTMAEFSAFHSLRAMAKVQLGKGQFRSVSRFMSDASENDFSFYNVGILPYRRDTLRNAGYDKLAFMQEFYYRRSASSLASFRIWYQQSDRDLPQLMSYQGAGRKENLQDKQLRGLLEVKNYLRLFNVHYTCGFSQINMHYLRESVDIGYINEDADSRERSLNNRLKISRNQNKIFSFGAILELNFHEVRIWDMVKESGYDKCRTESGVMLNAHFRPSHFTALSLLSATEYFDGKVIPFIPSAGFEWQVTTAIPVILKANLSRNYHKPGLNDLYWIPGGNPGLRPEDGRSAEISGVVSSGHTDFSHRQELTVYYSRIKNWIIWQPASDGAWYWEASNLNKVISRGLEYSFTAGLTVNKLKFMLSGNYALTIVSNPDAIESVDHSRNKQLVYIPRNTANLHAFSGYGNWSILVDVGYTGRRYTQSNNQWTRFESVLTPFWLTNASVQKKIKWNDIEANIKVKADNIFNINYQQVLWRPMPGRYFSLILSAQLVK